MRCHNKYEYKAIYICETFCSFKSECSLSTTWFGSSRSCNIPVLIMVDIRSGNKINLFNRTYYLISRSLATRGYIFIVLPHNAITALVATAQLISSSSRVGRRNFYGGVSIKSTWPWDEGTDIIQTLALARVERSGFYHDQRSVHEVRPLRVLPK